MPINNHFVHNMPIGDMIHWARENSKIPEQCNVPFVLDYWSSEIGADPEIRYVITTKQLLSNAFNGQLIACDTTFKLQWLNFSYFTLGTIDKNKMLHPIAYALCKHERQIDFEYFFQTVVDACTKFNIAFKPEVLVSDCCQALIDAFYTTFITAKLNINCYFHVLKNIQKRVSKAEFEQLSHEDLKMLQLCPDEQTFCKVSSLFIEKWKAINGSFTDYFSKQWIEKNSNWFEGALDRSPSTNNATEGQNSVIKKKCTLRRLLSFLKFNVCMFQMLKDYSNDYTNETKFFKMKPDITIEMWRNAVVWALPTGQWTIRISPQKCSMMMLHHRFMSDHRKAKCIAQVLFLEKKFWTGNVVNGIHLPNF